MSSIVIVGAGVEGLTTALELKEKNPSYSITIAAKHLPGDVSHEYSSPMAGANWHSFATKDDKELQYYDSYAYDRLLKLAETEPECGITISTDYSYVSQYEWDNHGPNTEEPWYKDAVQDYKILSKDELPKGIAFGFSFKGFVITVPVYLNYLYSKCLGKGITIKRISQLTSIDQALELHSSGKKPDFVINCTGILVSSLKGFNDPNRLYPVVGQILHVRNNGSRQFEIHVVNKEMHSNNESFYIFPRGEGGCIIGGCFKPDAELKEDKELTERLIKVAKQFAPELVDPNYKNNPTEIDIVTVKVGQRPFRDGGVRIEVDPEHSWLIHNYGAGGGGYQGSYGFSQRVCELIA